MSFSSECEETEPADFDYQLLLDGEIHDSSILALSSNEKNGVQIKTAPGYHSDLISGQTFQFELLRK